jgi:hypothetical protein
VNVAHVTLYVIENVHFGFGSCDVLLRVIYLPNLLHFYLLLSLSRELAASPESIG